MVERLEACWVKSFPGGLRGLRLTADGWELGSGVGHFGAFCAGGLFDG